jgi:hypothetical protein
LTEKFDRALYLARRNRGAILWTILVLFVAYLWWNQRQATEDNAALIEQNQALILRVERERVERIAFDQGRSEAICRGFLAATDVDRSIWRAIQAYFNEAAVAIAAETGEAPTPEERERTAAFFAEIFNQINAAEVDCADIVPADEP